MRSVSKDLEQPEAVKPEKPDENDKDVDEVDVDAYKEELKEYVKEKKKLKLALRALYAVIWGQCSRNLIFRLEAIKENKTWKKEGNCSKLLENIRQIVAKFEHKQCPFTVVYKQMRSFFLFRQREGQSIHEYREVFQNSVKNMERFGVSLSGHGVLINDLIKNDTGIVDEKELQEEIFNMEKITHEAYREKAHNKFLAACFLLGGREDVYRQFVVDLENSYMRGHNDFTSDVVSTYDMMSNYKSPRNLRTSQRNFRSTNTFNRPLTFVQAAQSGGNGAQPQPQAGTDGTLYPHVRCYRCNNKGHYSDRCPTAVNLLQTRDILDSQYNVDGNNRIGFGFFQCGYNMMQSERYEGLDPNWVLLDSQSNCNIFCNKDLLTNVRLKPGDGLTIHTNGGNLTTNLVGDVKNYGKVWYSSESLANILSVANVRKSSRFNLLLVQMMSSQPWKYTGKMVLSCVLLNTVLGYMFMMQGIIMIMMINLNLKLTLILSQPP